jgi:hypothetical protein
VARPVRNLLLLVIVLAIAAGGAGWWWQRGSATGMNPLERWCADQLRRVAGDLLTPTFAFDALQLEPPATVTLTGVALTSDGASILTTSSMTLVFSDPPKRGHPLVIREATFVDPQVRLIGRDDGSMQGFSGLVASSSGKRYDDGGSSRPSDVLAVRRLAIRNGTIEWHHAGHEHPMRFERLGMDLSASPDAERPGWYAFTAKIDRPPVVELAWDGGLDVDTGDLAFDDATLQIGLSEDRYAALTPSIQDFLRRYAIVGSLTLRTTGHVPLNDSERTDLAFDVKLRDAHAAFGSYEFPVESATMKAAFRDMRFAYDPLRVSAFGGTIDSTGDFGFDGDRPFDLTVKASHVLLQDMMRPAAGKPPRLTGTIDLTAEAKGARGEGDGDATLEGGGTVTIAEANLMSVPAITAIADEVELGHAHRTDTGIDRGTVTFTLSSDRATIDALDIQSTLLAARGRGDIHFDGRLAGTVNAGVIEKAESLIGEIGELMGKLTDRLLPYEVAGTWKDPHVTPEPLGLGGSSSEE